MHREVAHVTSQRSTPAHHTSAMYLLEASSLPQFDLDLLHLSIELSNFVSCAVVSCNPLLSCF